MHWGTYPTQLPSHKANWLIEINWLNKHLSLHLMVLVHMALVP